jgi:hypothetical protein
VGCGGRDERVIEGRGGKRDEFRDTVIGLCHRIMSLGDSLGMAMEVTFVE